MVPLVPVQDDDGDEAKHPPNSVCIGCVGQEQHHDDGGRQETCAEVLSNVMFFLAGLGGWGTKWEGHS